MANVQTAFTPSPLITLFSGLPVGTQSNNIYPRAKVTFQVNAGTIAAKIATNTSNVLVTGLLPANYAYRIASVYAMIDCVSALEADNYEQAGRLRQFDGLSTGFPITTELFNDAAFAVSVNAGNARLWYPKDLYQGMIFNTDGATPTWIMDLADSDAVNATAAGRLFLQVEFLQYGINQATDVSINAPAPISPSG